MNSRAILLSAGGGIILWAVHFAAVYGYTAFACARGLGGTVAFVVGIVTLIGCAAGGLIVARAFSDLDPLPSRLAAGVTAFAVAAMAVEGVSAMLIVPCR